MIERPSCGITTPPPTTLTRRCVIGERFRGEAPATGGEHFTYRPRAPIIIIVIVVIIIGGVVVVLIVLAPGDSSVSAGAPSSSSSSAMLMPNDFPPRASAPPADRFACSPADWH